MILLFQYILETFTETRTPQWDFEAYRGKLQLSL